MHWAFNPKSDIARIYLSRKDGCGGPIGVEDTVKLSIVWLDRYVLTSEEGLPISVEDWMEIMNKMWERLRV